MIRYKKLGYVVLNVTDLDKSVNFMRILLECSLLNAKVKSLS